MLADLATGPATRFDLAVAVRLHPRTMSYWLDIAKGMRLVRIGGWERRPRHIIPIYVLGKGADAPKPKRMGNTIRSRRWRDAHPEQWKQAMRAYNTGPRRARKEQLTANGSTTLPPCEST